MLVVFKSAPILKRALKVRQSMMQLYILKLLKMQTKYLGRQWRKTNMKTLSAIYQKVRHRLNDDWAYGNGKYMTEMCSLGQDLNHRPLCQYSGTTDVRLVNCNIPVCQQYYVGTPLIEIHFSDTSV